MKDYHERTQELSTYIAQIRKEHSEMMDGFTAMSSCATKSGALDQKTKELIALAIGVSKQCDGCIGFHAKALVKLGATRAELIETLGMAIYMGGGPALMYAADALKAFEQFSTK